MTNKKFKVAAMSMALTACVAAQPLIANAADDVNAVSNDAPDSAPQSEGESTASAPVAAASVSSDPETNQQSEGAVDVIGDPDISVDYNHDNDKVTKDDSSTTTESTGPVNRDVPHRERARRTAALRGWPAALRRWPADRGQWSADRGRPEQ